MTLLDADDLQVGFSTATGRVEAVRGISFTLEAGECFALVGESGSGKSVTARALVGLAGSRAEVAAERLALESRDLLRLREREWRAVRGRRIGFVLQDALSSLDPLRRVGAEVAEPLRAHGVVERDRLDARVAELLRLVGIPDPERRAREYPHQLSGGLRQRALIASAIAADPQLLVADEPTTALDVTIQAQVLDLLTSMKERGIGLLLISHDLAVVARLADRVGVMYAGRIVESGPTGAVIDDPQHPYTRALLAAVPMAHSKGTRLSLPDAATVAGAAAGGCSYAFRCALADDPCRREAPAAAPTGATVSECFHPGEPSPVVALQRRPTPSRPAGAKLLEVASIGKRFAGPDGTMRVAVDDVSFTLGEGETLGIVGESGSGKTTAARIALALTEPDAGSVLLEGRRWSGISERERRGRRSSIQPVFQDPLDSFDPRSPVEGILAEALRAAGEPRGPNRERRIVELLDQVGLGSHLRERRPLQLSGGQRQRVAIARALACRPRILVCDEPVSALDVSVQAQVLDLLADLQQELGLALLFISHDLGVIHHISDRILVMKDGRVVERGSAEDVFQRPSHPYTQQLLAAVPRLEQAPTEAAWQSQI